MLRHVCSTFLKVEPFTARDEAGGCAGRVPECEEQERDHPGQEPAEVALPRGRPQLRQRLREAARHQPGSCCTNLALLADNHDAPTMQGAGFRV